MLRNRGARRQKEALGQGLLGTENDQYCERANSQQALPTDVLSDFGFYVGHYCVRLTASSIQHRVNSR